MEAVYGERRKGTGKKHNQTVQRMEITTIGEKKRRMLYSQGMYRAFPPGMISFADQNRGKNDIRWYNWNKATLDHVAKRDGSLIAGEYYLLESPRWYQGKPAKQAIQICLKEQELMPDTWIKQPVYATGDMFAAVAAALSSPFINILIKYSGQPPLSMLDFYREALQGTLVRLAAGAYQVEVNGLVKVLCHSAGGQNPQGEQYPIKQATKYTEMYFDRRVRERMNEAFGDRNAQPYQALSAWLQQKGMPRDLSRKRIFIVWMRFSGFLGGAHPEQDSSYKVLRQIISLGMSSDTIFVVAGDRKMGNNAKVAALENSYRGRVFDFTEFWRRPGEVNGWGGDKRFGQIRLYDYLKAHSRALRHIGSRSGNLEGMALLGHKVTYMDQKDSIGAHRMEAFARHDVHAHRLDQIGYDRLTLDQPATMTGKYVNLCMVCVSRDAGLGQLITEISRDANTMGEMWALCRLRMARGWAKFIISSRLGRANPAALLVLNRLAGLEGYRTETPNSQYPAGMESDHNALRAMYLLAMLAAKYKKDGAPARVKRVNRGLSPRERGELGDIMERT